MTMKPGSFIEKPTMPEGSKGALQTGEEIIVRGIVKPIPTLRKPLMSVDFESKEPFKAQYERSDTCIVPAAGVVGEAVVSIVLAQAVQEKFGGDTIQEIRTNLQNYRCALKEA